MLDGMSSGQFQEWGHFYALEPWGVDVDDYRMAVHLDVIAKIGGSKSFDPWPLTMRSSLRRTVEADPEVDKLEAFLDAKLGLVN
jgi:hypothetical protein